MPIDFLCNGCNQQLRVDDSLAGQEAACPTCGAQQQVPVATMAAAPGVSASNPFSSPQATVFSGSAGTTPPSGMVTAVGVVHFVMGGLQVACGLMAAVAAGFMEDMLRDVFERAAAQEPNADIDMIADFIGPFVVVVGIFTILFGSVAIVAGYGVVKRKTWGRVLSLVVGGVAMVFGLCSCAMMDPSGVINLGYGIFVYVVLLNRRYAAEFG